MRSPLSLVLGLLLLCLATVARAASPPPPPRPPVIAGLYQGGKLLVEVGAAAVLAPVGVELILQALAAKISSGIASAGGPSASPRSSAIILGERPVLITMGAGAALAASGGALLLAGYLRERKLRPPGTVDLRALPARRGGAVALNVRF